MHPHSLTPRFHARARIITTLAIAAGGLVVVGGGLGLLLEPDPHPGIVAAYAVSSAAIVALVAVFAVITARHARTLRALRERHPDDIVLLARRLPPVVSDLPAFLRSKGVVAEVGDGWYAAVADERGISVHSGGSDPREIVLMAWDEIGELAMVRTATVGGDSRWSIAVDVRPYATPMTVDVGSAAGIVTMALDAGDISAVMRALEAKRPAARR
jgi:hypothetical protein